MHAWGSTTPPGHDALALARIALLPSGSDNTVGSRIALIDVNYFYRSCCLISECYQLRRCNREHR